MSRATVTQPATDWLHFMNEVRELIYLCNRIDADATACVDATTIIPTVKWQQVMRAVEKLEKEMR